MILPDHAIIAEVDNGRLVIDPWDPALVQPASVDVLLGDTFIDQDIPGTGKFPLLLYPGRFILASTVEYFEIPDDLVGRLEGKSSLGRLGLSIHATAGFVDPGFRGQLTLELSNVSSRPIQLTAGMKIAQMSFHRLESACRKPYGHPDLGSKYQGQTGPTVSRTRR